MQRQVAEVEAALATLNPGFPFVAFSLSLESRTETDARKPSTA